MIKNREGFERHAAPEAVDAELSKARARLRAAQREVYWLTELLGRRTAEQAAGVWPGEAPTVAEHWGIQHGRSATASPPPEVLQ